MNTCDYDRLAAREMLLRFGVKRYRLARLCKCGRRAYLFNKADTLCYECCLLREAKKPYGENR